MPDVETCLKSVSLATAFSWHRRILAETGKFVCVGAEFAEILSEDEQLTSLQISPKPFPDTVPDMSPSVALLTRRISFTSHSAIEMAMRYVGFF